MVLLRLYMEDPKIYEPIEMLKMHLKNDIL